MDDKILFIGIGFLVILLILTVILLIWYSGILDEPVVGAGQPPCGLLNVVYKYGRGPYKNVGANFTEVTSIAPKNKCFGIYYDDPRQVDPEKLRWAVGCVLSEGTDPIDPDVLAVFQKEGYRSFRLPAVSNAVLSSFPYKSQISVLVAMYKTYPQMSHYIKKMRLCAHPFIELYTSEVIHCYAPLSKQESFYVPETDPSYVDPKLVHHNEKPEPTQVKEDKKPKKVAEASKPGEDGVTEMKEDVRRQSSTQRVPDITELVKTDTDSAAQVKSESVVPQSKSSRASLPVTTKAKVQPAGRAQSVNLSVASVDSSFNESSLQDAGVSSTMSELSQTFSDDTFSETDAASPNASFLSSENSYSCSEPSMAYSSQESELTESSQDSPGGPLVELSSDSETERSKSSQTETKE